MSNRFALHLTVAAIVTASLLQAQSGGTKQVAIDDPILQMKAWTLEAPAGWEASGTMLPGSSCMSGTSPIYRASTPDGKAGAYFLPRMDWAWGPASNHGNDCLPFQEAVSAKDFLTYFIRLRKLGFVSELPVPELAEFRRGIENQAQQSRNMGMQTQSSADMARYLVRYSVNGEPVEERVTAQTMCSDTVMMAIGHTYSCSAFVMRWFAPLGKLQGLIPQFQSLKLSLNQQWMAAWTAAMVRRTTALSQQQTQVMLAQGKIAGDQRMKEHQDFMASMERGRDLRNDRFVEGQYAKTKNKEDFVDYISDCQRLSNGYTRVSIGNCQSRETGGY